MANLMYLFVLAVIFTNASSQSNNPYTIVDGNLSVAERFHFTIHVEEMRGVILLGIDSRGDQFRLQGQQGAYGANNMRIMFNKVFKVIPLTQLCGCDPCNDTAVTFIIKLQNGILSVGCNNIMVTELPSELRKSGGHGESGQNTFYQIPAAIAHQSNKIFITMGNIGPYNSGSGGTVFPIKGQLVGCLMEFLHNDSRLTLVDGSSKFKSSCQFQCANNTCNGGMCQERPSQPHICDCSSAPLNGPHCNKELMTYIRGQMNTYDMKIGTKEVNLKVTWRPLLSKVYCLVNMVQRDDHFTISTNGTHVMINGSTLDSVNVDGVNVVRIKLTDRYAVVKTKNHKSRVECSSVGLMRINVGFSESADSCETFEGAYDLQFDPQQLLPRHQEEKTNPRGRIISNGTPSPHYGSISNTQVWFITCAIVGIVVLVLILFLLYRNVCKNFQNWVKRRDCNAYEIENVDLRNNESRCTGRDGDRYNSIESHNVYIINYNDYKPIPRDPVDEVPLLPPRR